MRIYSRDISENELKKLVNEVKTGKYAAIGEEAVRKELVKHLTNNPAMIDRIGKKSVRRALIKLVKKALYKGIGAFTKTALSLEENLSTKDRHFAVYKIIFKITGIPKKIVDLGAGINPLSYKQLRCTPEYIAYDINNEFVKKTNEFFRKNRINGKAFCKDILQIELPEADVYFLFKLLESVELIKSHKTSEELIKRIPAKWSVVSFSTKTLSGKQMNVPKRRWFELMLKRLNYKYESIETENELFYVIRKSNSQTLQ